MLGRKLAGRIDPAVLTNRADGREIVFLALVNERPVDLAGRELDESFDAHLQSRLDHLIGTEQVHLHRPDGAAIDRVDAGDGRAVNHYLAAVRGAAHVGKVEDVALHEVEVFMAVELRELERVAMEVVEHDDFIGLDEPLDEV